MGDRGGARSPGAYASSKTKTHSDINAKAEQHGAGVLSIFEARDVARSGLDRTARKVGPKAAEIAQKAEEKLAAKGAGAVA